jgi:hypothetical protein
MQEKFLGMLPSNTLTVAIMFGKPLQELLFQLCKKWVCRGIWCLLHVFFLLGSNCIALDINTAKHSLFIAHVFEAELPPHRAFKHAKPTTREWDPLLADRKNNPNHD